MFDFIIEYMNTPDYLKTFAMDCMFYLYLGVCVTIIIAITCFIVWIYDKFN